MKNNYSNLIINFVDNGNDVPSKTYNIANLLFTIAWMKDKIGSIVIILPSGEPSPVKFSFEYVDGVFSRGIMYVNDLRAISYVLDNEYAPLQLALAAQIAFGWIPYGVPNTENEFRALIETIQERKNPEAGGNSFDW